MSELDVFPGDTEVAQFYKIQGPFKRTTEGPDKNKIRWGMWSDSSFATLQHATWRWTEKLDGMNIRIHWSGHRVSVAGRTDRAQIASDLLAYIHENFTEELFEQAFQGNPVTLYGEGVGPGIQKGGGLYATAKKFVLFEVRQGNVWRTRETIESVADSFGCEVATVTKIGTVWDAIEIVKAGHKVDYGQGEFFSEGLVGVPVDGFLNYNGSRIALKIKHCDFFEGP